MGNILEIHDLTKTYPGVIALDNVSINIKKGEVHALVGENGAGKSTLIKTITGASKPDSGKIIFEGKEYPFMAPRLSGDLGIEAIYQEFNLAPSLSVQENIFMGTRINKGIFIDTKALLKKSKEVLDNFNVEIDPLVPVGSLSVAYMQLVEIAKALAKKCKLLIMDEPTAPLTDNEVEILYDLIKTLKEKGVSIIYISHRLDEIFHVCDTVTIMRDGKVVKNCGVNEIDKDQMIYYMVGHTMSEKYPQRNPHFGNKVLEIKDLEGQDNQPSSFYVRAGEILGLAGLVGAGRTELARLIFGADKKSGGDIYINGQKVEINSPKDAISNGIAYVSEDRKNLGVILKFPVSWNITLPILKSISHFGFIDLKKEDEYVCQYKDALRIKTPSVNQLVNNLSGGNQQKVAVAKWLASHSKILILDEPTRGIDVGAKEEIYELINHLTDQGLAIIMISSEMEEIMKMSDRMIVLSEGRITGELSKFEFNQEKILRYASNIVE